MTAQRSGRREEEKEILKVGVDVKRGGPGARATGKPPEYDDDGKAT